jgi:glyoxylase-like metal-dependent hydrolase (beta-lactamase superfamily II)
MDAPIKQISKDLYQVTLVPPIPGFNDFICSWVHKGSPSFVVDAGPSATSRQLLTALEDLDVRHLDYILITHIHIDHAGAVSDLARVYPDAAIVCHPAGIPHLEDPVRLWEGSVKTLGDVGKAYGPLQPVPGGRMVDAEGFTADNISAILTPGHSPHHASYQFGETLFAGETGGVFEAQPQGGFYLRPATPPRFFMDVSINSINLLMETDAEAICYGHYGISHDVKKMLATHRDQLQLWNRIISEEMGSFDDPDFTRTCIDRLLRDDPLLQGFSRLDEDKKERERFFFTNSIKGFALSLKSDQP